MKFRGVRAALRLSIGENFRKENCMSERSFFQRLEAQWARGHFVCVGLDSEYEKIPEHLREKHESRVGLRSSRVIEDFNCEIIRATHDIVCAYKPNMAFYEGELGLFALKKTVEFLRQIAPEVPVILDFKRGDIGNTNRGSVKFAFDSLQADAVTVSPYLGIGALKPFLERKDRGIFILCRTSNPEAGEFQDLLIRNPAFPPGMPDICTLYEYVALRVTKHWNSNGNCALIVGATQPEELARVRAIVGDMPILIPGIGAQGGDLQSTLKSGLTPKKQGVIINSSRGVIYASSGKDFSEIARCEVQKLNGKIQRILQEETSC